MTEPVAPATSAESVTPAPAAPTPPSPEPAAETSALRQMLGLFVVPLLVVALCVGIFVGFGWIAYERHSVRDYLNDLNDPRPLFGHRRWQAAYELARLLAAKPAALAAEPGAAAELRRLFAETEEPELARYLALVLGRLHDREAVPAILAALERADAPTRIYLLWALGEIGDGRARPALEAGLVDSDSGVRKTAAFAVGQLTDPPADPAPLRPLLADPVADVRWNAALALAQLDDLAAVPVVEQMLDRVFLAQVPGITLEQQEQAMTAAAPALARLVGEGARPVLDRLASSDPSLKVRQAAHAARERLESSTIPAPPEPIPTAGANSRRAD